MRVQWRKAELKAGSGDSRRNSAAGPGYSKSPPPRAPLVSLSQALAMQNEPNPTTPSPRQKNVSTARAPARMFVIGRVLDPQGKPVPNAAVMIHARNYGRAVSNQSRLKLASIGNARTGRSGRFRIDAPRTSSWRYDDDLGAVAMAPGFGVGSEKLDVDSDEPTADITLRPEQIIEGRLVDGQGRPVPDVSVSVRMIGRNLPPDPDTGRSRFEGVIYPQSQINDLPVWPKPALTSANGCFTLRGVGRDLSVDLTTHHPRFALQRIRVETSGDSKSKSLKTTLDPAQILTGRVTYADSGQASSCRDRNRLRARQRGNHLRIRGRRRGPVPRESFASGRLVSHHGFPAAGRALSDGHEGRPVKRGIARAVP